MTDVVPLKFLAEGVSLTTTLGTGLLNLSVTLTATVVNVKPAVVLTGAIV